ncbi:MAG: hypothetical protein JF597_19040 [Streptomyces sp.]|jgi:Trypsin-co-occurring domain 1|uniref:CU044_2847 family protein n=1 Tax=Streptomyces sp. TaxID=1931 RepID=UPI0025FB5A00|nr:CU044_2847 family protein [Streptomyces sp.]MBW8795607.1 hypothetical protein [Streptomyces sp.]
MRSLARIPLDGGGTVLVEAAPTTVEGPLQAGRLGDAIRDLPTSLQTALGPVRETARAVVEQLRHAGPGEIEVEFGVDLSAQAGAVITKSEAGFHLKVRVLWQQDAPGAQPS